MTEEKKGIKQILSDTIESLSYIYNIIDFSSEEEVSSPLEKKWSFYSIISDIRKSLLTTFLNLTDNELRILDYVKKYKAITARNITNFLQVSNRQIYRYLKRLEQLGFIIYSERSLGNGPHTRFYHFTALTRYELEAAEALERAAVFGHELTIAFSENNQCECTSCGEQWVRSKSLGSPTECVYCKTTEVRLV